MQETIAPMALAPVPAGDPEESLLDGEGRGKKGAEVEGRGRNGRKSIRKFILVAVLAVFAERDFRSHGFRFGVVGC
jgi:hypothetical protein